MVALNNVSLEQKQGLTAAKEQSLTEAIRTAAFYSVVLNNIIGNLIAMLPEEKTDAAEAIEMTLRDIYEER